MGLLKIVCISVLVLVLAILVHRQLRVVERHELPAWKNFGDLSDEEARNAESKPPRVFKVKLADEDVSDFKGRLMESRLPPVMDKGVHMTYGFPSHALPHLKTEMLKLDHYQWAKKLNAYDHFKVSISGLDVHYVMIKGNASSVLARVPLLLLHGWPGSFYEFYSAVPKLLQKAEENGFTYDIIIPSLPGYGFSEPPTQPGCSPRYVAAVVSELMARLGYGRYVVQGGDWGSFVAEWIVGLYPERVMGFHVNMFQPPQPTDDLRVLPYQIAGFLCPSCMLSAEEAALSLHKGPFDGFTFLLLEGGYFHLQATKPDSVGVGLSDSPLGLAAYIMEKFYTWTDGDVLNLGIQEATERLPFSVDEVLCNILVYWHTNTILPSMRLYKEAMQEYDNFPFSSTKVPAAVLMTKHEITFSPEAVVRLKYRNLKQYTALQKGGHFAAFEMPEEYSNEVVAFTKHLLP